MLEQVAAAVDMIEETQERQNISACVQILAGLRFEKDLIRQLFREEIMRESVIYQDILQKGLQEGKQEGKQEEALTLILRLLTRRLGAIAPQIEQKIRVLLIAKLEDLGVDALCAASRRVALLDFSSETDLISWLDTHSYE
ncbi:DUF4351 domain-containing protein [Chlorogloeopsis fritschii]|uniref:DUF4351 domain-containing protein n=1 Tax=Chlorogloeopsis fritschii TaxID=1124 RepID=UPI0023F6E11F|nr:DUF4351 domain-containing protein [Chlorogloeopsis fritschii]